MEFKLYNDVDIDQQKEILYYTVENQILVEMIKQRKGDIFPEALNNIRVNEIVELIKSKKDLDNIQITVDRYNKNILKVKIKGFKNKDTEYWFMLEILSKVYQYIKQQHILIQIS